MASSVDGGEKALNVALPSRMVELFAGYGGLGLGVSLATGAGPVVYVERGAFAASVLVARMEEKALVAAPVWNDVSTFDGRRFCGVVDCVVGGSPCQDLSVAGKRAGLEGARSGLWREMLRVVRETGPAFVFWENVGGAIASALDVVASDLEGLGFRVAACTLGASDVGAPHERQRLFVLAHSDSNAVRLEPERQQRGGGASVTDGSCGDVAHPNSGRQPQPQGPVSNIGRRTGDGGEAMGDSAGVTAWGLRIGDEPQSTRPRHAGGGLADPNSARREGHGRSLGALAQFAFPPGPGDARWREWVGPQPSICRSDDGAASGLEFAAERLELLGNGVVPQQAAVAFLVCWQRLFG